MVDVTDRPVPSLPKTDTKSQKTTLGPQSHERGLEIFLHTSPDTGQSLGRFVVLRHNYEFFLIENQTN